jgi:hypothetical protein
MESFAYHAVLFVHSWLRWLVLLVAVWVCIRAYLGWFSNRKFVKGDGMAGGMFVGLMHLQLLIGLLLYFFLSPLIQTAFTDFGAAMKNKELRYWSVEHMAVMVLAVIVAQIGRIISKRAVVDQKKHQTAALYFTIALLLMLSRIPFDQAGRLLRQW